MKTKKRRFLLACGIVAAAIVGLAILSERALNLPPNPVGITFINDGVRGSAQPSFRVTNHTSKVLFVTPWNVAVSQGADWTEFQHHGPGTIVSPHEAVDVVIDFSKQEFQQPTNTWILTLGVAERLNAVPAFILALKKYPGWLRLRNDPRFKMVPNPLSKGTTWYGNPCKVQSEEIKNL
jgi:hypothetical protein